MKDRNNIYRIGIDAGSTTLKTVVLDVAGGIVHRSYLRHKADIGGTLRQELSAVGEKFAGSGFAVTVTGSAGMGISERLGIPFVQEVVASVKVARHEYPQASTLIDLGGEDAKMVFLDRGRHPDIRMNGSCAGGTGSFIDQMADLMNVPVEKLDALARGYHKIYPIASRCGVFAKTDVQNLIGRGVPPADLAMSILHTVALQSITSLARGCDIKPKVLCIGGPLTFIPSLREAFRELLGLGADDIVLPEEGQYFPAWGAALETASDARIIPAEALTRLAESLAGGGQREQALDPLFGDKTEYIQWLRDKKVKPLKRAVLGERRSVDCLLGVDSGSTTTKVVVLDTEGNLLYSFYGDNRGDPLKRAVEGIRGFYEAAAREGVAFRFTASAATGYGEELVRSALGLDYGIVETMAHLSGAQWVDPRVSFVLDIGGQDIKSIFARDGVISNVELNEACSSGCGSFLQNFASAMNLSLEEFTRMACASQSPADLGSRCTVFMNSKVKQALRENAAPGDIAAGLAYSVVKNCLFKVLKISNLGRLGDHIVVQGGTFRNDAVYRALELLSGKSVSSTDSPELMGALGAALYAGRMAGIEGRQSSFSCADPLPDTDSIERRELQCAGCANRCEVLRFRFPNGATAYSGNKCEKVFYSSVSAPRKGYNAFDDKNRVLFDGFESLSHRASAGTRGVIGIPRVLNMFENYPFWHTLLAECGFGVELSPESTFSLYRKGVGYVMSENICFPAKLVHGHIVALAERGVDRIFFPMVAKEEKELRGSTNSFNCPVVSGYPDVVRSSMDPEGRYGIPLDKPVITFHDDRALERGCAAWLGSLGVETSLFKRAFARALAVREEKRRELVERQKQMLDRAVAEGRLAFVVAGRPYHADPLINQKVGQILSDLGVDVFTDDVSRASQSEGFGALKIVSQWSYPNRVVQAAMQVARLPQNVQLVQLNSFGCGPDSFFMDETGEILRRAGKSHTLLRIDEIASPGSIRLRLRSLTESLRAAGGITTPTEDRVLPVAYTKEDRPKTILLPWFSDFISPFIPALGELAGYRMVNLPRSNKQTAEAGLKYGHNEVCYPSTLVLGDIITALRSGEYDLDNIVVAITQTGGQCRATNYIAQIKNGLQNAGFGHVPVIVLSSGKVYQNDQKAFRLPFTRIINIAVHALLYADALQQMHGSTIVREKSAGDTQRLFDRYIERGIEAVRANDPPALVRLLAEAVADFNAVPISGGNPLRVGLVGEIYVKYNDYGQAHTTEWLRSQGVEVVTPPILDFVMLYFVNTQVNRRNGVRKIHPAARWLRPVFWKYMNDRINRFEAVMKEFRFHIPGESIFTKAEYASDILDLSNQFGEGWSLAADVAQYARLGVNNIVCVQPFGCIANHIVAKGIERRIKKFYPEVNMLYLDVDGGMAEVNLQNRLHFLIRQDGRM